MDDSRLTAMSGNRKVIMSLKITQLQRMSSLFARQTKKCTYPNVYQYFINLSKKYEKIVFWPHLASAHYANDTLVRLEDLKIEYVPQIRPIEKFWANLKRKVYSNNYRTKYVKCLMANIRKELKKVPAKVRKTHRLGVTFFCK
jgi:hypothetical protein